MGSCSGYEHYQVRYESSEDDYGRERNFWIGIKLELQEAGGWSQYELKDGRFWTWMDDDLGKYRFGKLQELQRCILAHGRTQRDRTITIVVDHCGNTGKTFLSRSCWLNGTGSYIDGSGRAADIIADVYDISEYRKVDKIFIDLTRNTDQNRCDLWAAIEQIKNGYLKDRRFSYREKWIKPPTVFVFTNNEPKWETLSKDRWDKMFLKEENGKVLMWDRRKDGTARIRIFNRNN